MSVQRIGTVNRVEQILHITITDTEICEIQMVKIRLKSESYLIKELIIAKNS